MVTVIDFWRKSFRSQSYGRFWGKAVSLCFRPVIRRKLKAPTEAVNGTEPPGAYRDDREPQSPYRALTIENIETIETAHRNYRDCIHLRP